MADSVALTEAEVLQTLANGEIEKQGLLPYSSNHSFLVIVRDENLALPAVYKPERGENPLWDFEWGTLCMREAAAYLVSAALNWRLIPPTVLRDGFYGRGSVQFYIDHDADEHYFTVQDDARFAETFRQLSLFDFIVNNADRKSGHCLIGHDDRLWAIDHGICFHTEYKLRTVIWEFSGEPIEDQLLQDLSKLQCDLKQHEEALSQKLYELLNIDEYDALLARVELLLRRQSYPVPQPHRRNYPWPPV
ncbi:MAG: SCO1664 family protein [Caldilineaceae bacterium]|nr:SCO1664 family protein [Caldilineaceae bacterium]